MSDAKRADGEAGALDEVVAALAASVRGDGRGQRLGRHFLPSRAEILALLELLWPLLFPGFAGALEVSDAGLEAHLRGLLSELTPRLEAQIERCLCHRDESIDMDVPRCRAHGRALARRFVEGLPALRRTLLLDLQAAHDGDPAASSLDEIVLAYPGFYAVVVHRVAHALMALGVPLMPRVLSEHAHTETGADIHPGAQIGERFFIDHATGVVIGQTTVIGAGVKIYQGVTLGALSMPRDPEGNLVRGTKRHPTVEDDVTIYANATVLGGDTVIGRGAVIGGGVFLTRSVAPAMRVALGEPRLRMGSRTEIEFEI